ncbi:hypothetical protein BDM02DRAFT_2981500 [Thelephora ganbajun]|uniref:Uncharacterized protein n=1 Tax=Thelephora ganbajun TaxID=370292 RepID=A0ACB6ZAY8_THEGA|nr:hypothetical protein BDM02DRAFT_2981500 [Thelephora ganbajun]
MTSVTPVRLILLGQANKGTIKTAANVTDPNQYQEIVRPNQFYHQEEDRGRGFSTKGFLDTHTRFPRPGVDNFNTPAQQPQVQAQSNPVPTPATSLDTILCEQCFASFPSLQDLKQHKIVGHSWRCMKCFNLPPFEDWIAWRIHFNTVHAAGTRSVAATDVKGKKIAIPTEDKPSQLVRDDPGHLGGLHLGEVNGQRRNASQNTNIEVNSVATHLEPFSSSLVDANKHIISSLPPEVVAPSVTQDEIVSSASHDKGFLTSKGPTLNILVEIDLKPRQGRDGLTYEIASDIASPTMIVSSIDSGEPEGKYDTDVFSSHSSGLLDGNSLEKEQHIIISPRGPELGDREGRTM